MILLFIAALACFKARELFAKAFQPENMQQERLTIVPETPFSLGFPGWSLPAEEEKTGF